MAQAFHKHNVLRPICWIAHSSSLPASYVHEQTGLVLLMFSQLYIPIIFIFLLLLPDVKSGQERRVKGCQVL